MFFCSNSCEYFSFSNKRKLSFRLHSVPILFLLMTITLIVHLYSIVYNALSIARHIALTLQNNFIKKDKTSETISLVTALHKTEVFH